MRVEGVDTGDVELSCLVAGEGPVVLALHGFPDNRETFLPVVPALTAAGFRVVMPALRGYRPSGVARGGRHDAVRAGADAVFLARHYSPDRPVRIVGHDWGAVAAFAAVGSAPQRFSHLVTMAVPHVRAFLRGLAQPAQLRRSWYMAFFQLRGVAEARLSADDHAFVDRLWRDWSPGYAPTRGEMEAVKAGIRGREREVLAYYRALFSPRALLGAGPVFGVVTTPSIHVHGEEDGCVGVEVAEGAARYYAGDYELHRVAGAGHFLTREKPGVVGEIVSRFLGSA